MIDIKILAFANNLKLDFNVIIFIIVTPKKFMSLFQLFLLMQTFFISNLSESHLFHWFLCYQLPSFV